MPTIKPTEAGQDSRRKHLEHLREIRKDVTDLAALKNTDEWVKLVRMLRKWSQFAKNEEDNANAEHDKGEIDAQSFSKKVTRARQKIADFDLVSEILDKQDSVLRDLDAEISKIEAQYKSAKEELQ